jgi:hypothetical protein
LQLSDDSVTPYGATFRAADRYSLPYGAFPVVRWLLSAVRCLLSAPCCLLSAVCFVLFDISSLPSHAGLFSLLLAV